MKTATGKRVQKTRIVVQALSLLAFFLLLIHTGASTVKGFSLSPVFFYIDPLIPAILLLSLGIFPLLFLWSLIPLVLTLVFGRFFCGWFCPFGAIHQFFSWWGRKREKKSKGPEPRGLRFKYMILLVLVVAAFFGVQLAGWLDPFSLLTRSSAVFLLPAQNHLLQQSLHTGAGDHGWITRPVKPLYRFSRDHILTDRQRVYAGVVAVAIVFLALIVVNIYKRRFFCNSLCPLGAIYGFFARFSLLSLKTTAACKGCNACANTCTYSGSPHKDYFKSECLVCFNCVADCPFSEVEVSFAIPKKSLRPAVDLGRRAVVGSMISGLALAAVPGIACSRKKRNRGFIRPPGSLNEGEFLKRCTRCGECMQACPTNAIHPAQWQAGVEELWTPVLMPDIGYCEYECLRCTRVCPTGAIAKLTLEEKKRFKIGTAVINRNLCYTHADGYNCGVCEEHCPIPEKAIKLHSVEVWNFRGRSRRVDQVYVDPRLCIGCGICQNVCPRTDTPAITVGAEEEQRELGGKT